MIHYYVDKFKYEWRLCMKIKRNDRSCWAIVIKYEGETTYTSGKKCISIFIMPSPSQFSHLPPATLNENLPAVKPRSFASGVCAYNSLMGVNAPV